MQFTGRSPIVCYPADVGREIYPSQMFVASYVYSGYTDPAHKVVLTDNKGGIILDITGKTTMGPVKVEPGMIPVWGPTLTVLESGTLSIYFE